jgi:hypothetical protein
MVPIFGPRYGQSNFVVIINVTKPFQTLNFIRMFFFHEHVGNRMDASKPRREKEGYREKRKSRMDIRTEEQMYWLIIYC